MFAIGERCVRPKSEERLWNSLMSNSISTHSVGVIYIFVVIKYSFGFVLLLFFFCCSLNSGEIDAQVPTARVAQVLLYTPRVTILANRCFVSFPFSLDRKSENCWNQTIVDRNPSCVEQTFPHSDHTLFALTATGLDLVPAHQPYVAMDTRETPVSSSAMPIPRSRILTDFIDLFDIDQSQSSDAIMPDNELSNFSLNSNSNANSSSPYGTPNNQQSAGYGMQPATSNSNAMWSAIGDAMCMPKQESYNMDDDDIFQVDKADLFQGPTLAELNDDTILEDLNIDDYILQEEHASLMAGTHPTLMLLQSQNSMGSSSLSPQPLQQSHNQNQIAHNQHQMHQSLSMDGQMLQNQQQLQQQQQQQQQDLQAIPINDLMFEMPLHPASPMFAGYQSSTPTRSILSRDTLSPQSQASSNSSNILNHSVSPPLLGFNNNLTPQHKGQYSTLQELLKKEYALSPDRSPQLGQSVPGPSTPMSMGHHQDQPYSHRRLQFTQQQQPSGSRLSSSAPANSTSMWEAHQQQMWQRREPRQHLLSTGSVAEAESLSSLSTAGILSPEAQDFSHDEGYDDSDSDHYEDYSTDNGKRNHAHHEFHLLKIC